MQNRRETLKHSAVLAGLLAAAGYPQFALAAFNKADIAPTQFAAEWMDDYAAFQAALDEESERSESYSNSLTRSLSLSLDEFYRELRHVGVSSLTGAGFPELLGAVRGE